MPPPAADISTRLCTASTGADEGGGTSFLEKLAQDATLQSALAAVDPWEQKGRGSEVAASGAPLFQSAWKPKGGIALSSPPFTTNHHGVHLRDPSVSIQEAFKADASNFTGKGNNRPPTGRVTPGAPIYNAPSLQQQHHAPPNRSIITPSHHSIARAAAAHQAEQQQQRAERLSRFPTHPAAAADVDFAGSDDSSSEWCGSSNPGGEEKRQCTLPPSDITAAQQPPQQESSGAPSPSTRGNDEISNSAAEKLFLTGVGTASSSFFRDRLKLFKKPDAATEPVPQQLSSQRRRRLCNSKSPGGLCDVGAPATSAGGPVRSSGTALETSSSAGGVSKGRRSTASSLVPTAAPAGHKMKEQLAAMTGQIRGFESQLMSEIEQRRSLSAHRLESVRAAVTQLKTTLEVEISRRIEMQKELHQAMTQDVASVRELAAQQIAENRAALENVVEDLSNRVAAAQAALANQLEQQNSKINRISHAVDLMASQIESFKNRLTADIQLRRQRSEALFDKLAELERSTQVKASTEAGLRERDRDALTRQMAELREEQRVATNQLQEKLVVEFRGLKDALEREAKTREQADDDIVKALNHYTQALQTALRIANA